MLSKVKKLYAAVAAILILLVVLVAMFLASWSNAEVLSLDVHYSLGEKFTYDLTTSSTSQTGNSSTNSCSQSTLTIEVLRLNGDTYTLNYTTSSTTTGATSHLLDVKDSDMVNLFTLLPVALLQYENTNSSPIETAVFNQSEAKVGDTWHIPLICTVTASPDAEITVKFVAIQDLAVKAGNFKVFKIEFTQASAGQGENYGGVFGESYLEFGSCKQIQSTLQFNMTTSDGANSNSAVTTFSSRLIKDENS